MKSNLLLLVYSLLVLHNADAQLSATVTSINDSCGVNNGSATVTASGGSGYSYRWSNGDTGTSAIRLSPGTYTVTVYCCRVGGIPIVDTIYSEDFQGPVTWTINIPTGYNDFQHNIWAINDTCGGAAVGTCAGTHNGDKTLHVHATAWFAPHTYIGALYNASPPPYYYVGTDLAAQSPAFSTAGASHLILSFDYIGNGQDDIDVGSLYYSLDGGTTFILLDGALKSPDCYENLGIWAYKSYSLPSSCNNVNNFVLRFRWVNNEDNVGTDPAIGINNIFLGDSVGRTAGTFDSVVKTVTVYPIGDSTLSLTQTNTIICPTDSATICAASGFNSYVWNNHDSTQCITTNLAGNYSVTATNNIGCTVSSGIAHLAVYTTTPVTITVNGDTLISYHDVANQWFLDGGAIQGDTSVFIIATQPGSYTVQVTDTNGCQYVSNAVIISGISNLGSDAVIKVYPNPSSGQRQVEISEALLGSTCEIFDAQGKSIYQGYISKTKSIVSINAAPGIYLMKISSAAASYNLRLVEF